MGRVHTSIQRPGVSEFVGDALRRASYFVQDHVLRSGMEHFSGDPLVHNNGSEEFLISAAGRLPRRLLPTLHHVLSTQPLFLLQAMTDGRESSEGFEHPMTLFFLDQSLFRKQHGDHADGVYDLVDNATVLHSNLSPRSFALLFAHELGHGVSDLMVVDTDHRTEEYTSTHLRDMRRHFLRQFGKARNLLEDREQKDTFRRWWNHLVRGSDRALTYLQSVEPELLSVVKSHVLQFFSQ